MNLLQMKYYKKQKGYSLDQLAELSGVPRGTLQKIFSGETKSPRHATLQAIEQVLKPAMEEIAGYHYGDTEDETQKWYAAERAMVYGAGGTGFTVQDYYALPDSQRVELIDGVFYDMAAPSVAHQVIAGELYFAFRSHIDRKQGSCLPLISPLDVQLDCDDRTMVEPDFLVVCNRDKVKSQCIMGAPDFVAEILSPTRRKRDTYLKLNKYACAGVREYWIIDPEKKRIICYFFEEDDIPVIHGEDAVLPVKIFDGELEIRARDLFRQV